MNKVEAIAAMLRGEKVTHEWFTKDEWMTYEGGKIVLEDGVRCHPSEFWRWRTDDSWNNGYSLFIETHPTPSILNKQ
jgi:hypothetical protein